MASLKSFLYGMAPVLGMSGAALYERQRVLVNLGALEATPGRGPGSGVPLTPENVAVVLISVLAAENLSDLDEGVAALCRATPRLSFGDEREVGEKWRGKHKPIFKNELGRILTKQPIAYYETDDPVTAIGVRRPGEGYMVAGMPMSMGLPTKIVEFRSKHKSHLSHLDPIQVTAEIGLHTLQKLIDLTCFALAAEEGEEE
jgi:hypothetical protein